MATATGGPNDLYIVADDGKIYFVSEQTWKASPAPDGPDKNHVQEMSKLGTTLAKMVPPPTPINTCFCVMVNLASLRVAKVGGASEPDKNKP